MEDNSNPIKISITGKLNYEDQISLNQAAQIIAFIDSSSGGNLAVPAAATRLAPQQVIASGGASTYTPREALDSSKARTNPEKIVAFANLVLNEGQKDTFTLEDVKPLFRRAREATPKNISRDFDVVIRSGWAADAEEKGEYYLTRKGLETVESGFEKEHSGRSGGVASKTSSVRKPRKTSVEVPVAFKDIDPIPNSITGLPDYTALSQRKERFLWVLQLAKTLDMDGLSNQEIVWLTDRLGSGIAANNINSAFTGARKSGFVNKSTKTNKIRITPQGETFLQTLSKPKQ